jgi:hypothetical protein
MTPITRTVAVAILSLAVAPPPDDVDTFIQTQMAQREIKGFSSARPSAMFASGSHAIRRAR